MIQEQFARTELLLGTKAMEQLEKARVAVFGIGGVGSFAAEALARSGIGHITLVDGDEVSTTNINRQLIATLDTVGQMKTEVMKERIGKINENAEVEVFSEYYKEDSSFIDFSQYSYVIDAIDMVSSKLLLIERSKKENVPIISCMGAGNKLDPTLFRVADISETTVCPLAKVMRKECKERGLQNFKVVYSLEPPLKPSHAKEELAPGKRQIPGSVAFVPSAAGLILASEVVRDLCKER